MKRKILFIILSYYQIINSTYSQTIDWAKSLPGSSYVGSNVITDRDSNVYTSGVSTGPGMTSGFIIKYAHDGSILWGKSYGGSNSVNSMCADSTGNLYVVIMIGTATIDSVYYSTNTGNHGGYLFIKYDVNGAIIWVKQMKPSIHLSDKMDSQGNLIASGGFADTVYLENGIILLAPPPARTSFFIGKFNDNGECIWAIQDDGARYSAPIITKNNDFFFKDWISTTITLGKGSKQVTFNYSNGGTYCAKYDSTGDLIWAKQLRTAVIAPDEYGNAYTFEFEDITTPPTAFITKYDQTGNLIWKKTKVYTDVWSKVQMQCGPNGDVYFSGGFGDSIIIDSTIITGGSANKMFVAKIDSSGALKWISTSSGSGGAGAKDITVSGNEICITGDMNGQNTFGSYTLNQSNYSGVFTLKITDDEMLSTSVKEKTSTTNGLTVYPNPSNQIITVLYSKRDARQLQLSVKNQLGKVVYSFSSNDVQGKFIKDIDLGKQAKGIYFIEVVADEERLVKKVVLD